MLTKEQEAAASHNQAYAGGCWPGSGKTRVLTERIQRLLQYTEPERIVVFTFARKAAEEMQQRFAAMAGEAIAKRVCFGTFHSVFYRWLRQWGAVNAAILDEDGQKELWKELGWDMEDVPAFLLCHRDAAERYIQEKKQRGLLDFEDIIDRMEIEILRHRVWEAYDYFLIDEFQDINPQQYEIVRQMTGPHPNLFVVGDEDQAIYAFRGSDPGLFLQFAEDYPGCQRVDLTMNFRCQKRVVEAAGQLIVHNRQRLNKQIVAFHPPGKPVKLHLTFDEREEAKLIRDQISRQWKWAYREMAVLCRTTAQVERIAAALEEGGIPYKTRDPLSLPEHHEELLIGRDLEVLWRLSRNPADREAFRKALRFLPVLKEAGNWRQTVEGTDILKALIEQQGVNGQQRRELTELKKRLAVGARMEQERAFRYWLWQTDYWTYAAQRARRRGLSKWQIWQQIRRLGCTEQNGVLVSTMHGAKGLEFDWVWVAGLVEGECPRQEAIAAGNLEEERRLLYVAMTRARKVLNLSSYQGLGAEMSQFLKEIKLHVDFQANFEK